jgi:D-glycero-D-manno-heptose 1,7-bisphosphate phosphatase
MVKKKNKKKVKIAFLDRDGVLNSSRINNGYIGFKKDFKWITGAIEALKLIQINNYKIVIVTNQSGIARNYFSMNDVKKLHEYMVNELKKKNIKINAIYFCPFHIDGIIPRYKKLSILRKPNNGMFLLAKKRWNIDIKNSFMIGDQITDMQFAKKSRIKGFFFNQKNLFSFVKKIILNYL